MRVTIGELIEIITPWSNKIELLMVHDKPFMKVNIIGSYGIAKFFLYITQSDDNKYQVIDSDDDINNKIFPTGITDAPFVKEKDLIVSMFDDKSREDVNFTDNLDVESFKLYLFDKLYQYNIIRFSRKSLTKSIVSDMGFTSIKIKRILTKRMKEYHTKNDTVEEFINVIMNKHQEFDLYPMRPKEVNCIFAMLKNLGLEAKIDKDIIKSLSYVRRT